MKIIIIKFGGSSLADPGRIRRAAGMVLAARRRGVFPVAVVSAPADTTDDLLALAAQVGGAAAPARETDALMSAGEQFSAALMAMAIAAEGGKAVSLAGFQAGIITDNRFSAASVKTIDPRRLKSEIKSGRIPVVAGFQGITRQGDITTLGRGGSDFTAVALAHALHASLCEFRTDVKGIYTAHPALVPAARRIREISYPEIIALAELGTEVRQLGAIRYAMRHGIALHLRSSFHDEPGTLVTKGDGRPGVSCLSLMKSGGFSLVSAVGCGLDRQHEAKALAAAGPEARRAGASPAAITLRLPADGGDGALKRIHDAFFRKPGADR
jgi:aspartate kinase